MAISSGSIDWQVVGAAIATFFTTAYLSYKGWQDRKKETQKESHQIISGVIQDNMSMAQNTASLVDLRDEIHELNREVRTLCEQTSNNTHEMRNLANMLLLFISKN